MGTADQPSLRILHVITSLARGGAQTHLLELIKGQRARGHLVEVAYLKDPEMVADFFPHTGLPIPIGGGGSIPQNGIEAYIAAIGRLMAIIGVSRPDVLHTHLLKADAVGAICGWMTRIRRSPFSPRAIISSKHNDELPLRRSWIGWTHGLLSRADDAVICCSDHVSDYMVEFGRLLPSRIRRIYYGIDLARPLDLGSDRRNELWSQLGVPVVGPKILAVGRLDPQKGWPTLLGAMDLVAQSRPDAHLVIVGGAQQGDDAYLAELRRRANLPNLSGRVTFTGVREDVPSLMAACDLFALASRWEGFGLVFAEAMAAGRPVVATRVSGIPEIVIHDETGVLVAPDDAPALAQALLRLLNNREEASRFGMAGYRRVRAMFSAPRMIDETIDVYRDVLRARVRRP